MPTGGRALKSVKSASENHPCWSIRQAAQQVAEGGAEEHGQQQAGNGEDDVPCRSPERILEVASELDGDAAQDQHPQNEEDREVEAGETRREHRRKGREERAAGGEQPHFVAVPVRPDCAQDLPALGVRPRDEEMQGSRAQIESVENDIGDEHHGGNGEPEFSHDALRRRAMPLVLGCRPPAGRTARDRAQSHGRSGTGTGCQGRSRDRQSQSA